MPANGTAGAAAEFVMRGDVKSKIIKQDSAGCGNFSMTQTSSGTVLRFTRYASNGRPEDAQIAPPGKPSQIIFALGNNNTFSGDSRCMDGMSLVLQPGPSPSPPPTPPSPAPSPPPPPPSPPSPPPTPSVHNHTIVLKDNLLSMRWTYDQNASTVSISVTLNRTAWYVALHKTLFLILLDLSPFRSMDCAAPSTPPPPFQPL
jgi:hypothetical protein